jgi:hypothetical protein
MQRAGLTVAFSTIFAERLQRVPLTGEAGLLARRIGLLSPDYERIAQRGGPDRDGTDGLRHRTRPAALRRADGDSMRAVAAAFRHEAATATRGSR